MRSGQRSYIPGVGYIAIVSVEPVELARLTDDDALLDGFPSADLLRTEIRTLYEVDDKENLTPFMIRFSVYPPQEQERIALERQKEKQEQQQNQQCDRDGQQQEFVTQTLDKLMKLGNR